MYSTEYKLEENNIYTAPLFILIFKTNICFILGSSVIYILLHKTQTWTNIHKNLQLFQVTETSFVACAKPDTAHLTFAEETLFFISFILSLF